MKLNKKKVFALAVVASLIAIISLGSLAWFTDTDSVTNDFMVSGSENKNPDEVFSVDVWEKNDPDDTEKRDEITFEAILPGDDLYKEVNIENTGSYDQYIRAIVTISDAHIWQDVFDEIYVSLDAIATDLNADFEVYSTVYDADEDTLTYVLYYNAILPFEGEDVVTLFTNVAIPEALDRYQAAAMAGGFVIDVVADAVQTENVGDNAVEAFETVGMGVDAGDRAVATTAAGLWTALNAGVDLVLTNDIDMAGYVWVPVRSEEAPYAGTFDGNGYTLSNFAIGADPAENAAMFACVNGAVVKNLKFENVSVGGNMSATVAYYAENTTFENIQILSGSVAPAKYGAAIVHEADAITIKDCVNYADISTGFSASGIGAWILNSTVEGCANYGEVSGANRAAGICANFSGEMTNCTNNGNVTATGNMPAGGIIAVLSGATTIEGCTNNGDVTTTADNANASAAGILGHTPSAKVTIKNCVNNGNITAEKSHAAGIAVSMYGGITAEGCSNTGSIVGEDGAAEIAAAKGIYGGKNTVQ